MAQIIERECWAQFKECHEWDELAFVAPALPTAFSCGGNNAFQEV
jgi:hypothetical protein